MASYTTTIPKNDAGRLVATTFVIIAAVKTFEKLRSLLLRPKKPTVREGIVWRSKNGEKFAKIAASGLEGADDAPAQEAPESIWQVTRVMEKRAMKEAREREFFYKAKLSYSRTVTKDEPVRDDISIHEDDDEKQVATRPVAAPQRPMGFPGMPGMMPGMF